MADPTRPIDPARFALALESLPLDTLHAKAAEIRNSINHLKNSNEQMLPFADEGDDDCREAMFENLTVIGRMNERIGLLRAEVEKRGFLWGQHDSGSVDGVGVVTDEDDVVAARGERANGDSRMVNGTGAARQSGRLTDEELRRQLEAQMGDEEDDDGVHL